jgi:hypothetical protein
MSGCKECTVKLLCDAVTSLHLLYHMNIIKIELQSCHNIGILNWSINNMVKKPEPDAM